LSSMGWLWLEALIFETRNRTVEFYIYLQSEGIEGATRRRDYYWFVTCWPANNLSNQDQPIKPKGIVWFHMSEFMTADCSSSWSVQQYFVCCTILFLQNGCTFEILKLCSFIQKLYIGKSEEPAIDNCPSVWK
jgi:hypothetical protein